MTVSETLPDTQLKKSSTTRAGIVGTIHARLELRTVLIKRDKKGGAAYVNRTRDPIITDFVQRTLRKTANLRYGPISI